MSSRHSFSRFAVASNNILLQLLNIVDGDFFSEEKEERICLLKEECPQIVSLEAKKAVTGRITSLSLCQ